MFLNTGNSFFKVKTKLLSDEKPDRFERTLNEFVKDKKVLDIQYKPLALPFNGSYSKTDSGLQVTSLLVDRALVTYVDEPPMPERDLNDLCPYWDYRVHASHHTCTGCMEEKHGIMIDGDRYCTIETP